MTVEEKDAALVGKDIALNELRAAAVATQEKEQEKENAFKAAMVQVETHF